LGEIPPLPYLSSIPNSVKIPGDRRQTDC